MARQNMRPQPYLKHMEAYNNFSGGLNTVTSNDNLRNSESPNLLNVDLGDRGSIKRRYGSKVVYENENIQGMFTLSLVDEKFSIEACDGSLYHNGDLIEIEGLEEGFQTENPVEAIQYTDKLYIATGTKLVEVWYEKDELEVKAKVVEPYRPQPLEALYVGTNALAENPDQYLQDGESAFLRIEGVIPDTRYGITNESVRLTVFVSKPSDMVVEYKVDNRRRGSDTWRPSRTGFTTNPRRTIRLLDEGEWEFMVYARPQGETNENLWEIFYLPRYEVSSVDKNEETERPSIHSCSSLILHWDRLIMYGDKENPTAIYISHLKQPNYFPMSHTLSFDNDRNEPLTKLLQFRDMIVAFSDTKIQALFGRSPLDYRRLLLNTEIGCIAPETAKVVENHIYFLSSEGVYRLKSVGLTDDRANVEKVDTLVENVIPRDRQACAEVFDGQYHITFPASNQRFRYYFNRNVWTRDFSECFSFKRMYLKDSKLRGIQGDKVYEFDPTVYADGDYIYESVIETKMFDFGEPYNPKKLKELQLLMKHYPITTNSRIYVYADTALIVDPLEEYAHVNEEGEVEWIVNDKTNLKTTAGTIFGKWELSESPFGVNDSDVHKLRLTGKCRRTRIVIKHHESTPQQLLGLGVIFKVKKP